jgi:hypothetical protein
MNNTSVFHYDVCSRITVVLHFRAPGFVVRTQNQQSDALTAYGYLATPQEYMLSATLHPYVIRHD